MAEKILVVEDDCISLKNLSLYLLMSGYDVEEASDGLQALQKLERGKFDLVLSIRFGVVRHQNAKIRWLLTD
jgi:CheY-like chemotaxis protein